MDKQKLIDLFFANGTYSSNKSGNVKLLPEVNELPGDSLSEKVWNGLYSRPACYCGKSTAWINFKSGYRQYCGSSCAQSSPFLEFEKRHRQEKLWADPEWKDSTSTKMKDTHFKNKTPAKLEELLKKGITPLDEIVPGQSKDYLWMHSCGRTFTRSFARTAAIYCPECHVNQCQGEVYEFIRLHHHGHINVNDRKALAPKEIDIYLPELKLGFYVHGKYWDRADLNQPRFNVDNDLGIRVVHLLEREWKKDRLLQEQTVLQYLKA